MHRQVTIVLLLLFCVVVVSTTAEKPIFPDRMPIVDVHLQTIQTNLHSQLLAIRRVEASTNGMYLTVLLKS